MTRYIKMICEILNIDFNWECICFAKRTKNVPNRQNWHASVLLLGDFYLGGILRILQNLISKISNHRMISFLPGGWWISWSPFVGMFIAKISRGRTIAEFIMYTLTMPILYSFVWLSVFGGVGIRMDREAENRGINCTMYKHPLGNNATLAQ